MSLVNWKNNTKESILNVTWAHWNKLGANVHGNAIHTNCDPEAMIILSGLLAKKDPRLLEILGCWINRYESIINIERLKSALQLIKDYPLKDEVISSLVYVLLVAIPKTDQKRWKAILALTPASAVKNISNEKNPYSKSKKIKPHSVILKENQLINFRFLFGASAKADVLNYVKQTGFQVENKKVNISAIARKLRYHPSSVHRVAYEIAPILMPLGSTEKIHFIGIDHNSAISISPPKQDSFFLDWFKWVEIVMEYLTIETDLEERNIAVVEFRIKKFLQTTIQFAKDEIYRREEPFLKPNIEKMSLAQSCEYVLEVLDGFLRNVLNPSKLNWGEDHLTQFLENTHHNSWAMYVQADSSMFQNYIKLDNLFVILSEYFFENPKTSVITQGVNKNVSFLFHRTISAFLAAVRLCTGGQSFETTTVLRQMLECTLYALHLFKNPRDNKIFENRDKSPESRKLAQDIFKAGQIMENILNTKMKNAQCASNCRSLYDSLIDFGAHPNFSGVYSGVRVSETSKDATTYEIPYAALNDPFSPLARKLVKDTAYICLIIFQLMDPKSFEASGVTKELAQFEVSKNDPK